MYNTDCFRSLTSDLIWVKSFPFDFDNLTFHGFGTFYAFYNRTMLTGGISNMLFIGGNVIFGSNIYLSFNCIDLELKMWSNLFFSTCDCRKIATLS